MNKTVTKVRVRYSETDQMGFVHHGNYAQYFEMGRLEWLRGLGLSYKEMEENGTLLPVYEMKIRYHKPAYYDDILTVTTSLKEPPGARIVFVYEIHNENGELLTTGETTLVFVDKKSGKPMRCPEEILSRL